MSRAEDGSALLALRGDWSLAEPIPALGEVDRSLASGPAPVLRFEATALGGWDSSLVAYLTRLETLCRSRNVAVDRAGLPAGVRRLLELAEAVPERAGARRGDSRSSFLERLGLRALALRDATLSGLSFVGEVTAAFGRFLTGRARYRLGDVLVFVQSAGADALPIVTLISFLVGTILAFVGAVQLQQFGASIYVANLVGIAVVRDMGAMMTAIVMAGRTGASYAAQLGSMQVTQEIDAFRTMGISPVEFLVLPRMLALFLMMPLLCLYSDALGILGGAAIGAGMLEISPATYFRQTARAIDLGDLVGGLFKASVYGILIAVAGCLRGIQSGRSSSAVGDATTAAVVTSIVLVVSACGIFALVFYLLEI